MCLSIPGEVIAIEEGVATVSYGEMKREALCMMDVSVGDFVVVGGGVVIKKLEREKALEALELVTAD